MLDLFDSKNGIQFKGDFRLLIIDFKLNTSFNFQFGTVTILISGTINLFVLINLKNANLKIEKKFNKKNLHGHLVKLKFY